MFKTNQAQIIKTPIKIIITQLQYKLYTQKILRYSTIKNIYIFYNFGELKNLQFYFIINSISNICNEISKISSCYNHHFHIKYKRTYIQHNTDHIHIDNVQIQTRKCLFYHYYNYYLSLITSQSNTTKHLCTRATKFDHKQ